MALCLFSHPSASSSTRPSLFWSSQWRSAFILNTRVYISVATDSTCDRIEFIYLWHPSRTFCCGRPQTVMLAESDVILVQNNILVKLIIITFLLLICRFLARITSLVSEPSSVTGCESLVPRTSTEEVGDDPQSKVCKRDGAESVRPCKTLTDSQIPDYPLLPLSKGCLLTLQKLAVKFKDTLRDHGGLMT